MKKIILYCCLCFVVSCSGYEPLFSTKSIDYYIKNIDNINEGRITSKISKQLQSYSIKDITKKSYHLKINSNKKIIVASKDLKGNPLVYKMSIKTSVIVIFNGKEIGTIDLEENFNFNNNSNKFYLSQYKKKVEGNLIRKISELLIVKLQIL